MRTTGRARRGTRLLPADDENESCLVMQDIEGNEFCLDEVAGTRPDRLTRAQPPQWAPRTTEHWRGEPNDHSATSCSTFVGEQRVNESREVTPNIRGHLSPMYRNITTWRGWDNGSTSTPGIR